MPILDIVFSLGYLEIQKRELCSILLYLLKPRRTVSWLQVSSQPMIRPYCIHSLNEGGTSMEHQHYVLRNGIAKCHFE